MLWNLLTEFKEVEKENALRFRDLGPKFLAPPIFIITAIIISSIYTIHTTTVWVEIVTCIVILVTTYYWVKNSNDSINKKFGNQIKRYTTKINLFRQLIRKLNLYSPKKIEYLIELSKQRKLIWKISDEIFKPFKSLFLLVIIPIFISILNTTFNKLKTFNEIFVYGILILLALLILICLLYMIKPLTVSLLDKEYTNYNTLQALLEDIYLMDFVEEEKLLIL